MALNKKAMRRAAIAASSAALLVLTACGSDDGGSDTGSTDTGAAASGEGRGPITIVEGQDPLNAALENIIADWNAENPDEQVTFKPLAREANDQYADIAQRMQAQSDEYDLVAVDVTNTAEFAANGWLLPLEGDNAIDTDGLLPATVESGTYNGTLYAAPKNTNGAFLYYRTDLVDQAPATWDDLKAECPKAEEAGIACYIGQFSNYEGLTVNVTEIVNAFGGSFVAEDGLTPAIDDKTAEGLQFIVDSFEDGTIPAAAQTYTEGESQTAFGNGEAMFMRTWPGFYTDGEQSSVAGKYGIAVLPGVDGPGVSTLGGYNVGISAFTDAPATARDFLEFMQTRQSQEYYAEVGGAPVLAEVYDDPEILEQYPYFSTLKEALESAKPRPSSPYYSAVSKAISDNAYAAIRGEKPVQQALDDTQAGIETAGN
ncbi:ABC transporter substrate-binding protein [Rhodococcus sp. HNM0563]|uniref:ABC transporter substrate-binding protein n=1 Tax=unclassified Rhodococcus (in: high G+C Gram-positive bacteria) TaxID=192944 RepID=UPI00146D623E|nr:MULTISPECIES: ABC transporter substrate-binding protein [unclassified Rhodococcus (in: high G+C Gram-positive bacteria)]MCK0091540.1 ABC transporter substrate-binding protein [Rhodococcus sp. F64268]NLU63589.1 ABC transporter substrate-binding protein [Rhodococcus sp. HNM0563]